MDDQILTLAAEEKDLLFRTEVKIAQSDPPQNKQSLALSPQCEHFDEFKDRTDYVDNEDCDPNEAPN